MGKSKQTKHEILKDKAFIAKQNEKIINDFLVQFAYTLAIGVLSIFVYNAIGAFNYGLGAYNFTRVFIWIIFAISLAFGILFVSLAKIKKRVNYKISAIYSFVTAAVAFWYVGVEKIVYYTKSFIPLLEKFSGSQRIVFAIFPMLAVAVAVEFAVYFVRYYSLNSKKKR